MPAIAKHGTLTADTVATVSLTSVSGAVQVVNRGDTAIFYTLDGSTPTVSGDDTLCAPPSAASRSKTGMGSAVVKLISSGTPAYSVVAV